MRETIAGFARQFTFDPHIENGSALQKKERFLILGMGGSQLPASLVWAWHEPLALWQHRDYGLPSMSDAMLRDYLVIAVSYSGNTEETISGLEAAHDKGLACVVITVGGTLLAMARERGIPFVQLPDWGLQPRAATGLIVKALLRVMGQLRGLEEVAGLANIFRPDSFESPGKQLATQLEGSVPIIYASRRNSALAMIWKITLNETGKIPAFFHTLPELNHNEMTGFDVQKRSRKLSEIFRWVFLTDEDDDTRIRKRMDVLGELFRERGLPALRVPVEGPTRWQKLFSSQMTASWCALHTAEHYGLEATEVPMVEAFKKLMTE